MGRSAAAVAERPADPMAVAPWSAVLFNCECHTFDEVENILLKALNCTLSQARRLSNEVHTRGSAVVFSGPLERCEGIADMLGSIGLRAKVSR